MTSFAHMVVLCLASLCFTKNAQTESPATLRRKMCCLAGMSISAPGILSLRPYVLIVRLSQVC